MAEKLIDPNDPTLMVGQCPHCKSDTVFRKTRDKNIYTCRVCYKTAKQFKNGKIHWFKVSETHPYIDYV